ncbi:hypothetical protein DF185_16330 [Marinifilum breve]|uniref:Gliding motility-associated C-terminal domain-containing protein n=1 Tax=Marinifilum breve TaxID=2184082 RepID=A0A2V3ZYU9_9BACT|nr:gliding motility-associated C-terminal domain-containing protein [Marinifilum breve]PXX98938.1 hypothetical protein DF185_16330 [Marinifilum breve]
MGLDRVWVLFVFWMVLPSTNCFSQQLLVDDGGMYLDKGTFLNLKDTSLENHGEFKSSDETSLFFDSYEGYLGGSVQVHLNNFLLNSDCRLTANVIADGDVFLEQGILDLQDNQLFLGGNLINEREESRITSLLGGEIVKTFDFLAGESINPGNIGISMILQKNVNDLEIRRGHVSAVIEGKEGIARYFQLSRPVESNRLTIHYFDTERNGVEERELTCWTQIDKWEQLHLVRNDVLNNVVVSSTLRSSSLFTLFPGKSDSDFFIPEGFSPDGDGINDRFEIPGIEQYPQNKLVVFNRWGDVVYECESYQNTWDGKGPGNFLGGRGSLLHDGTYFYLLTIKFETGMKKFQGPLEIKKAF